MLTVREPHTALFVAQTGVEKAHLAFDLLEHVCFDHFDCVVILYIILWYNSTYKSQKWFWLDPYVTPIESGNHLYD